MTDDLVKNFGYLTLGTRLKRLGDAMQSGVQAAIDELGWPVTAAQYPLLAALDHHGAMTITELVAAVGIAQPGVTRFVSTMTKAGLVEQVASKTDGRKRLVQLTPKGEDLIAKSKAILWPHLGTAVKESCAGAEGILQALTQIERNLASETLGSRLIKLGAEDRA